MEKYKCYHCKDKQSTLLDMINHCTRSHEDIELKYRELVLDDQNGSMKYLAKLHEGIVPVRVEKTGKKIEVRDGLVYLVDERSKKKKLNTPIKISDARRSLAFREEYISDETHQQLDDTCTRSEDMHVEIDTSSDIDNSLQYLTELLPDVLKCLEKEGQTEMYQKFNELLASEQFPMDNICYLLFLDLVQWFSQANTSQMRYQEKTTKFWQIGFRLFHGKFLRFMSGLRNTGQILGRDSERGIHDPSKSKINFAVPSRNNLYPRKEDSNYFYPGINRSTIESLAAEYGEKPLKLAVDGKKICRGKGKKMGDIDCWGYENKPTLQERKECNENETQFVKLLQAKIDKFEGNCCPDLADLPELSGSDIVRDLKEVVKSFAEKNKLLRENIKSLEQVEEKFKKLGGEDWKASRFYPVICSVRVNQCEAKKQIEDGLSLTDKIAHCGASLNGQEALFCTSNKVLLSEQHNLCQLDGNYQTDNPRYIPQRTKAWHDVRDTAKVTGSTCHRALGLGKLKEQQQHFDQVFQKIDKPTLSAETQKRMEYGSLHEIDAVATLTGKVLPFLLPGHNYFEEGCAVISNGKDPSFMVVSPDGSIRTKESQKPLMMYENKCKDPNAYSSDVYYKIPHYYVTQVLCEMYAYDCKELLFTCWAEQSMTVFHVEFDNELWDACWVELTDVYEKQDKLRPKRFSQAAKDLREKVKRFTDKNVKLVGEFPSCTAVTSRSDESRTSTGPYVVNEKTCRRPSVDISLRQLRECLVTTRHWLENTYHHLRTVATEILVFMVNDLDRMYHMEMSNAHPIAYALKGPSLTTKAFRQMTEHVIEQCEEAGLKIVATASDGQWHQYGVKDEKGNPLTLHQLHKDHWATVKSRDKSALLSDIKKVYVANSLSDVRCERSENGIVVYGHKREKPLVGMSSLVSQNAIDYIHKDKTECSEESGDDESVLSEQVTSQTQTVCLDEEFEDQLDEATLNEVDRITGQSVVVKPPKPNAIQSYIIADIGQCLFYSNSIDKECIRYAEDCELSDGRDNEMKEMTTQSASGTNDNCNVSDDSHLSAVSAIQSAHDVLYGECFNPIDSFTLDEEEQYFLASHEEENPTFEDVQMLSFDTDYTNEDQQIQSTLDISQINAMSDDRQTDRDELLNVIDQASFEDMLEALQSDEKAVQIRPWRNTDIESFGTLFKTKDIMNKSFQKHELSVCLVSIRDRLAKLGIDCNPKWPKYRIVDFLLTQRERVVDKRKVTPISIPLPKRRRQPILLKKLSASAVAKMPKEALAIVIAEQTWKPKITNWNAKSPVANEMDIGSLGSIEQWFTQPLVGPDGIVRFHFTDACHILTCLRTKICTTGISGLKRKAWEVAALSPDTNLNISVVVDCVDKQDVSMARRMFSEEVENAMSNDFGKEAEFCRLVRNWFDAEDEPSIDVLERCRRRMAIRDWLLQGYCVGHFPPPTRYVKGIPIVTFEGLVAHVERKLQMYAFLPGGSYNVRATGSQEVENFFSTFRDMEPTGKGTPKPDVIPEMMAAVAEVDNFRLDPKRPFFVKTTSAAVYSTEPFLSRTCGGDDGDTHLIRTPAQSSILTCVKPRNHWFDLPERDTKRHKRRMSRISRPDEPAHGERGVRQFHARDDSKILAHHRKGFMCLPEK